MNLIIEPLSELLMTVDEGWKITVQPVPALHQSSLGRIEVAAEWGINGDDVRRIHVYGHSLPECASRALTEIREHEGSVTWIAPDYCLREVK